MSGVLDARRPGFSVDRLARLIRAAVARMSIDLSDVAVLTEAATGAYSVTPVLAALAGARVTAVTATTRHGSAEEAIALTDALADRLGVGARIRVVTQRTPGQFAAADLVTNSGHLRPIVGEFADAIRTGCALSLMFEAWEIQAGRVDVDLEGLRRRGVRVAGTNERHPHVDVFSHLGSMAVAELADAGIPAYGARIGLLCDNAFGEYLAAGLRAAGASVAHAASLSTLPPAELDAVLVAVTPTGQSVLAAAEVSALAEQRPDVVIVQFWGDVSRRLMQDHGVRIWPARPPAPGHMAVLPSRTGPDAIVNLQAGGLKVGELLLRAPSSVSTAEWEYIDEL